MADQNKTRMGLSRDDFQVPTHDPRIGKEFGRIKIKKLIAQGGMANIYLASHMELNRDVVVKIPKDGTDPVVVARMMAEASSQYDLKRICGDSVLSILDMSQTPEPHIVMEYAVNSVTFDQFIQDNPNGLFDPKYLLQVLEIMRESMIAVEKAHAKGIIHRDIKPANILVVVDKSGVSEIYIIDWGLVKKPGQNLQMTSIGTTVGSPVFMAPEQGTKNKAVGPKADVFAAAASLFLAVMNELLFLPKNSKKSIGNISDVELVHLVFKSWNDKLIQERIKDCPKWLQSILAPAFTVDPDERITMGEFVELIEGGIVALKLKMAKSNNATVETPQLTEEVMREITGGKKKRSFGKVATLSLLGVLVLIAAIVGSVHMFGGSDEPEQETRQVDTAPMNIEPTTMVSPKVVKPVPKRARARPKPASLSSPPKGHVMPSDDYIQKLLKEKLKWCLQNGYRRRTYGKSLTNYLGCMRKRVNDLYYTKHRATAILLLDSTRPYFCFYPATKYDKTLRAECKRIKKDNKRYFKFVSALQGASYNKRLTARMPIRNRIRRERRAWFEKKHNLKSK